MGFRTVRWAVIACCLSSPLCGQNVRAFGPIPSDPLEMVTGQVSVVDAASRADVLRLLERARNNYALRDAGRAYDLKLTFTVNSGGRTEHDGAWEMEDVFDPTQGLRWTATDSAAYRITRISSNGKLYGEETGSYIPLRLHEARAALFDPISSPEHTKNASMRTATATYDGVSLTCVLLSAPGNDFTASLARRWDETEECIDPRSGLLRTHSQVPGRYYVYDYSNAAQLAGHVLPGKVVVTEAGNVVTTISVDSLKELPAVEPSLFVPTAEMEIRGRAIGMGVAQKIARVLGPDALAHTATAQTVCVFGVVTPTGQLVEAHSLQPSNPNSQAAIAAAKRMVFANPARPGAPPQQHFVFIVETFVSPPSAM